MSKKTLIVENDLNYALELEIICQQIGYDDIRIVSNYFDAIEAIGLDQPELLLIDVRIDGSKDGITLAQDINNLNIFTIILTSYESQEYYDVAKSLNNCFFASKPLSKYTLMSIIDSQSVEDAIVPFNNNEEENYTADLLIKKGNSYTRVNKNDIVFASANGDYCMIHTISEKFVSKITLNDFEKMLEDTSFFRCHRSHLVNTKHLKMFSASDNTLNVGKFNIPISRNRKKDLVQYFNIIN